MLLSAERPLAGAFAVRIPGAAPLHRNGLVPAVPPASTDHGKRAIGVPQELGRSCRLLSEMPAGDTGLTPPGPGGALVRRGANRTSGRGGTAKRRQRSAAGWAAGSRSALIVPWKQGNSPRRTLWREARRRPAGTTEGNMLNTSRFIRMSTGLGRIATGTLRGRANLSAEEPYALMRARTGLREPWWATARATRPEARKGVSGSGPIDDGWPLVTRRSAGYARGIIRGHRAAPRVRAVSSLPRSDPL